MSEQDATLDEFIEEHGADSSSSNGVEWTTKELHQISDITMGTSPKSEYYNEDGDGLPFFQSNDEFGNRSPNHDRWCSNPRKTAQSGDLLMTIRGTYVGQMNIADRKCCIGRGLAGIIPGEQVNGEFLFQYLNHIEPYVKSIAIGSTFDSVSSAEINTLEINVPTLQEQRKIASILYNVDQAIQKTEEIIDQTKRVRQGFIRERIISQNADTGRKEGTVGTRRVTIPEHWSVVRLGDVAEIVSGKSFPRDYQEGHAGPRAVIKVEDMNLPGNDKYIKDVTNRVTDEVLDELNKNIFPEDTVIHPRVGEALLLNKTRITTEDAAFDDNIMGWVPEGIDPEYLYYASTMIDFNAVAQTGTVPSINKEMAANFRFPLPPEDEQEGIVEDLSRIDGQISIYEQEKSQLQRLKQGLMQDLLSGEVRTADTSIEVLDEVAQHG